jgi:hypothetical protein
MSHAFFDTFLQIRALAEVKGGHACEGEHPEMRSPSDNGAIRGDDAATGSP